MEPDVIEETPFLNETTESIAEAIKLSDDEKRMMYYVHRMKLAVAIAIIRSTPPEMSPEAYASNIIQLFKEDNEKWKTKCDILEQTVIELHQKLQTISLKEKLNVPNLDLNFSNDNSVFFIAKNNSEFPSDLKLKIYNTVEFVRSFILIGSLPNESFVENGTDGNEKLRETVLLSISRLFEYLRSYNGLCLEFGIVKSAIKEVHRLYDSKANTFEKDLQGICMKFVENLLLDIYRTLEMNKIEDQHRRSAFIQMLAEHKKLTIPILCRLLREITIYSGYFETVLNMETEDFTPLLKMENAYYLLQTTEGTLRIMIQQKSVLNTLRIPKALIAEWNKTAEKSLLEIGTRFPMYSMYVWHIKILLLSVLEDNV